MIPVFWNVTPNSLKKFIDVSEVPAASIINPCTSIGVTCLIILEEGAKATTTVKGKVIPLQDRCGPEGG